MKTRTVLNVEYILYTRTLHSVYENPIEIF